MDRLHIRPALLQNDELQAVNDGYIRVINQDIPQNPLRPQNEVPQQRTLSSLPYLDIKQPMRCIHQRTPTMTLVCQPYEDTGISWPSVAGLVVPVLYPGPSTWHEFPHGAHFYKVP